MGRAQRKCSVLQTDSLRSPSLTSTTNDPRSETDLPELRVDNLVGVGVSVEAAELREEDVSLRVLKVGLDHPRHLTKLFGDAATVVGLGGSLATTEFRGLGYR